MLWHQQARVLLFGLDESLRKELTSALNDQDQSVRSASTENCTDCDWVIREAIPDIVFCSSAPNCFKAMLDAIKRVSPKLPIVVVSRLPEVSEWLDALEVGAADYCAAPFEASQLRWILESNLPRPVVAMERRSAAAGA